MSAANALSPDQPAKPASETRAAEPSMDDILASIRRIIADDQSRSLAATSNAYRRAATQNVTPPPSSFASSWPEREPLPVEPQIREASNDVPENTGPSDVEPAPPTLETAFAAPAKAAVAPEPVLLSPPAIALPLPHLNPPAIPPSIEEDLSVIAEIVNAGAASILNPLLPIAVAVKHEAPPVSGEPEAGAPVPETQGPEVSVAPPPPEPVVAPALDIAPTHEADLRADLDPALGVLSLHGFEAPPPADAWDEPALGAGEPLVSSSVGSTVESSFQALATSVFLQNTAAVEAMTREMLRPLLKTWLDDNLPTIVERLVRVEIERVARGSRS